MHSLFASLRIHESYEKFLIISDTLLSCSAILPTIIASQSTGADALTSFVDFPTLDNLPNYNGLILMNDTTGSDSI